MTIDRPLAVDPNFCWEDAVIGVPQRSGPYMVTQEEMLAFAKLYDPLPIHLDPVAGGRSQFGALTAAGCHMLAIRQRLLYDFAYPGAVVASIGYDDVRFIAPLKAGQVCSIEIEFLEKRESKSRPDRGVLIIGMRLLGGEATLLTLKDIVLVKRRSATETD